MRRQGHSKESDHKSFEPKKEIKNANPEDAAWDGPGVFPYRGDSHDGNDMGEGTWTTLGVAMELATKLGEIGNVARPGNGNGEGRKGPED